MMASLAHLDSTSAMSEKCPWMAVPTGLIWLQCITMHVVEPSGSGRIQQTIKLPLRMETCCVEVPVGPDKAVSGVQREHSGAEHGGKLVDKHSQDAGHTAGAHPSGHTPVQLPEPAQHQPPQLARRRLFWQPAGTKFSRPHPWKQPGLAPVILPHGPNTPQ